MHSHAISQSRHSDCGVINTTTMVARFVDNVATLIVYFPRYWPKDGGYWDLVCIPYVEVTKSQDGVENGDFDDTEVMTIYVDSSN